MPDTVNKFAPGTKVVYGVAGLCTVEGMVTMEVGGTQISMLKLVDGNGAVFKVSPAKLAKLGIRAVTSPEDVAAALDGVEKSPPPRWDSAFGSRVKRHGELIQKGSVADLAAVIRELVAMVGSRAEKSLEGVDRENFDKAKRRLADEMRTALGVPSTVAEDALDRLVYSSRVDALRALDDLDDADFDDLDDLDLSMDDDETMALLAQEDDSQGGMEDDALSDAVSLDALSRGRKHRGKQRLDMEKSVLSGNVPEQGSSRDEDFSDSHVDAAIAEAAEEARHRRKAGNPEKAPPPSRGAASARPAAPPAKAASPAAGTAGKRAAKPAQARGKGRASTTGGSADSKPAKAAGRPSAAIAGGAKGKGGAVATAGGAKAAKAPPAKAGASVKKRQGTARRK